MSETTTHWETHRHPNSVYGPQGVSYYSTSISPTEYLTVQRSEYGTLDWTWKKFTIRKHNAFGGAQQLASGQARTAREAKAAALATV